MIVAVEARHMAVARVGWERYLCVRMRRGLVVVRDRCLHRGGPLSLGTWDERSCSIVCPWHQTRNGPGYLSRMEMPTVRIGAVIHALVPDPDQPAGAPTGSDAA